MKTLILAVIFRLFIIDMPDANTFYLFNLDTCEIVVWENIDEDLRSHWYEKHDTIFVMFDKNGIGTFNYPEE